MDITKKMRELCGGKCGDYCRVAAARQKLKILQLVIYKKKTLFVLL
jgi:hypothetical protein